MRHVSLRELAISTAGIALGRAVFTGSDQDTQAAIELIGRAVAGPSNPLSHGYKLPEADASMGDGAIPGRTFSDRPTA